MIDKTAIGSVFTGLVFLLLAVSPVIFGPLFVEHAAAEMFSGIPNLPPSAEHPLGTQSEGRDMLAIMMSGIPATLSIGLIGGGAAMLVGSTLGLLAGYLGGAVDATIRTAADVMLTIPTLAVLILVGASFPSISILGMGLIIAATAWMGPSRVIRAQTLTLREREFIRIAKLSDRNWFQIVFFELVPNLIPILSALFVNAVATAMIATIGLEVLGLGPRNTYTLGNTIYTALYYTAMWRGMWWWWAPPVVVLVALFLALFFLSKGLDSIANPRIGGASLWRS